MALNLANVFASLGRIGNNAYLINQTQFAQIIPFTELLGFAYINPNWITPLIQGYDGLIRTESATSMSIWQQVAQTILMRMVAADDPAYGVSLSAALTYLNLQMLTQAASVKACTIGIPTVTANSNNIGNGGVFVTVIRGDGLTLQNVIAETSTLLITSDSYTGTATVGQEPWQWVGAQNVSSLGTNTPVGLWDWDWPQGSAGSKTGNAIKASAYANTNANLLYNGDFATWTGGTPALSYFNLEIGTWGTSIQQSASALGGAFAVQFNTAGSVLNSLTQQFDSSTVTGATAGTTAAISPLVGYAVNLWLKAGGVISGGVLSVSLVDSTGTVLLDQHGVTQTQTIALTGYSTSWTANPLAFRTPIVLPINGIVRLRIKMTTALAGAALLMDEVAMCQPTNLYTGGESLALFSNPAAPFVASPSQDSWSVVTTNNRGGASYNATFQTLISRLFQTPSLILPYSGSPTIADSLIITT